MVMGMRGNSQILSQGFPPFLKVFQDFLTVFPGFPYLSFYSSLALCVESKPNHKSEIPTLYSMCMCMHVWILDWLCLYVCMCKTATAGFLLYMESATAGYLYIIGTATAGYLAIRSCVLYVYL